MRNSKNQSLIVETDASLIRAELERLLSDRRFSGARQMSAFLRYIVSETLDGNANRIKAYTVGVDALGKADDFDAQSDPSVRVLALRLRKSLEAAYENEPECHAVIMMTVGSYVPDFYKPGICVLSDDEVALQQAEEVMAGGSSRSMSCKSVGLALRNDIPEDSHSAGRHLPAIGKAVASPRSAGDLQCLGKEGRFGEMNVARTALIRDSTTTMLREQLGVIMAVVLLAAAWQVSVNTTSAATVSMEDTAPQAEAVPVTRFQPCTGNALKNPAQKSVAVLSGRA